MRDFSWLNWRISLYLVVIFILSSLFMTKNEYYSYKNNKNPIVKKLDEGNIVEIFSGDYYSCALTSENKAFCWGFNPSNNILSLPLKEPKNIPINLYSEFKPPEKLHQSGAVKGIIFEKIYNSNDYHCGLTSEHDLYCWGHYLNKPDLSNIESPQPIFIYLNLPMNDLKFKSMALGLNHICAITIYSDLYCWGDNTLGQLGVSIPKYSDEPLAVTLK